MAPFVTLQRASIEPAFSPSLAAQVVLDCTCPAFWCSRNYGNSSWSVRSFNASHLEHCTALLHKCSFLPHFLIAQAIIPILIDNLMTQRVPMHTAGIFFFLNELQKPSSVPICPSLSLHSCFVFNLRGRCIERARITSCIHTSHHQGACGMVTVAFCFSLNVKYSPKRNFSMFF